MLLFLSFLLTNRYDYVEITTFELICYSKEMLVTMKYFVLTSITSCLAFLMVF